MSDPAGLERLIGVRRWEWDPAVKAPSLLRPDPWPTPAERDAADITGIELHHSARKLFDAAAAIDRIRDSLRLHVDTKRWRDIFYNLILDPRNGMLYEGRWRRTPSQSSLLVPARITIQILGDSEPISEAAERKLNLVHDVVGGTVTGHGERSATECPGHTGRLQVNRLRDRASRPHTTPPTPTREDTPMPTPVTPTAIKLPTEAEVIVRTAATVDRLEHTVGALVGDMGQVHRAMLHTLDAGDFGTIGPAAVQIQQMFGRVGRIEAEQKQQRDALARIEAGIARLLTEAR